MWRGRAPRLMPSSSQDIIGFHTTTVSSVRHQLAFGLRQKQAQHNEPDEAHARRHKHGGRQALVVDHDGVDLQRHKDEAAKRGHAQGGANGSDLEVGK